MLTGLQTAPGRILPDERRPSHYEQRNRRSQSTALSPSNSATVPLTALGGMAARTRKGAWNAERKSGTVPTKSVVRTVSRLIQLSPRIAVGFGNGLSEPALLLGGRQLGNEVDPVVNQLIVLGQTGSLA